MSKIFCAHGAQHRLLQACQTVQKQYLAGQTVLIYCSDKNRLAAFSNLLWSSDSTSFIPHPNVQENSPLSENSLIHICEHLDESIVQKLSEKKVFPWLLNLDIQCPPFYEHFDHILEIVSSHEEDKQYARQRIGQYQQQGHEIIYHQLSQES